MKKTAKMPAEYIDEKQKTSDAMYVAGTLHSKYIPRRIVTNLYKLLENATKHDYKLLRKHFSHTVVRATSQEGNPLFRYANTRL